MLLFSCPRLKVNQLSEVPQQRFDLTIQFIWDGFYEVEIGSSPHINIALGSDSIPGVLSTSYGVAKSVYSSSSLYWITDARQGAMVSSYNLNSAETQDRLLNGFEELIELLVNQHTNRGASVLIVAPPCDFFDTTRNLVILDYGQ